MLTHIFSICIFLSVFSQTRNGIQKKLDRASQAITIFIPYLAGLFRMNIVRKCNVLTLFQIPRCSMTITGTHFLYKENIRRLRHANSGRLLPKRNYWIVRLLPLGSSENQLPRLNASHAGWSWFSSHVFHSSAQANTLDTTSTYQTFLPKMGKNDFHWDLLEKFSCTLPTLGK